MCQYTISIPEQSLVLFLNACVSSIFMIAKDALIIKPFLMGSLPVSVHVYFEQSGRLHDQVIIIICKLGIARTHWFSYSLEATRYTFNEHLSEYDLVRHNYKMHQIQSFQIVICARENFQLHQRASQFLKRDR